MPSQANPILTFHTLRPCVSWKRIIPRVIKLGLIRFQYIPTQFQGDWECKYCVINALHILFQIQ